MRIPRRPAALVVTVGLLAALAGCLAPAELPGGPSPASSAPAVDLGVVIPAYVPPEQAPYWTTVVAGAPTVRDVILNPDDGPGGTESPGYADLVEQLRRAGIRVLGYVATGRGDRAHDAVMSEVRHWQQWYGVTSIFFDEASSRAKELSTYRRYVAAVHDAGGVAVLNPGVVPDRGYFGIADSIVTFEDTADRYLAQRDQPSWLRAEPAEKVWHIVIATPEDRLDDVLARARADGAGNVYVTDDDEPNPYDRLPAYWPAERGRCRPLSPPAEPLP